MENLPILGIDLDGCVDEAPIFFRTLTSVWPGKVIVITFRDDRQKAINVLDSFGIRYDEVVLVNTFDAKSEVIIKKGVNTYFDDQPEMLRNIPASVNVMLVRNEGNFDFDDRKWMLSNKTGKIIV
jgi:pantothenate kinase